MKQREGFEMQTCLKNDDELHRNDEDFLEALSYGMPPTAGWGCGIDRLAMLFCGVHNIREIILFPMFRNSLLNKNKK
jgi:lysyl-tRNA synthetase class 2